jgi:S1-C subfamily serine protease
MRTDWQNISLIEDYLGGKLSGEALENFEKALAGNPALLNDLMEHQRMLVSLQEHAEAVKLKALIEKVSFERSVASPDNTKVIRLWTRNKRIALVAASVSLVVALSSLLIYNSSSENQRQSANFRALRKDIDKIKRNQHAIIKDLKTLDEQKTTVAPANYTGTGFALTKDGIFVTSLHIVNNADSVFIVNNKGQRFKAKAIYRDQLTDLAILQITDAGFEPYKNLPYTFKNRDLNLGENVYTLGYPREDVVFGEGSLSAKTGFEGDTGSCQVSIPVNPGNSGGPLLDEKGNVIGIISGKQTETEGTAFAVKSSCLMSILESLEKDSLKGSLELPRKNQLANLNRVKQVKTLEDFVVVIKVYNPN